MSYACRIVAFNGEANKKGIASTFFVEHYDEIRKEVIRQKQDFGQDVVNDIYLTLLRKENRGDEFDPEIKNTVLEYILSLAGKIVKKAQQTRSREVGINPDDKSNSERDINSGYRDAYIKATTDGDMVDSLIARMEIVDCIKRLEENSTKIEEFNGISIKKVLQTLRSCSDEGMDFTVIKEIIMSIKVKAQRTSKSISNSERSTYISIINDIHDILELAANFNGEYIEVLASM